MKAIIYGAGNIGRGFIGQLFSQSGYELTFIDVSDELISALNQEKRYPIRILDESSEFCKEDIWVEGVSAVNSMNKEDAAKAISECDLMATAVGVRVLPHIAPVIAEGTKKRFSKNQKPLNIIICENLIDVHKVLEKMIKEHLTAEEQKDFDANVGLVEASIGRMVPIQTKEMQDGSPLRICTESYGFLPVDKTAFKGTIPEITGMYPFDNFDFYVQRKIFVHNMGHGICAYFGMIRGDKYIYETINHSGVRYIVQNAMMESAIALSAKFQTNLEDIYNHINDLLNRFSNKSLGDTCARVGADTVRKLGNNDRFIGSLCNCIKEEKNASFISAGCSVAIYCHLRENNIPQKTEFAAEELKNISNIEGASAAGIIHYYSLLCQSLLTGNFDEAIEKLVKAASTHRGNIIQEVI